MTWWASLKTRYQDLVAEYGKVAIGTYLVLFFGTWIGFWVAIRTGVDVSSAAAGAGTVGGAYVATKLTQPVRIGATLLLTPFVMRALHWARPPTPTEPADQA
jgi:hypothetical protein